MVWFHAASLGEFEQGRPIIERVREEYPDHPILLTFFSPSGYEVRKDFDRVDSVHYLPLDTPGNARKFLDVVRPKIAVFIRYEYWYNFLGAMFRREIPVIMVSSIFRKDQVFFKPYGAWFRTALRQISHFFVQNQESLELLESVGVGNKSLSGDTRFDRVWDAAQEKREFPLVERFLAGRTCLMAGSTWPFDDQLLKEIVPAFPDLKFVIVPHHVDGANIRRITDLFEGEVALYTRGEDQELENRQILVVDTIGNPHLPLPVGGSHLYRRRLRRRDPQHHGACRLRHADLLRAELPQLPGSGGPRGTKRRLCREGSEGAGGRHPAFCR